MASAKRPKCKTILVEGDSSSLGELASAGNTAVKLGAHVISNSDIGSEALGQTGGA